MKQNLWNRTPIILLSTFFCCLLWGSAFPSIKVGYRLFEIGATDSFSQLLFAGLRFFIAGIMVLVFGSISNRRFLIPQPESIPKIGILSALQTIGQYIFFYIGLAHASGVSSSIIVSSSTFFSILIAALIFHTERLNIKKIFGCMIGFFGVILVQLPGEGFHLQMHWNGEGFILLSALFYAMSSSYIKQISKHEDPLCLSGWQFVFGGAVLTAIGFLGGGRLHAAPVAGIILLIYMAFISAGAYSLWGILLKYNPVSKIAIFGFMNPVLGVLLSAVILGEQNQAFSLFSLFALIFISIGIITVFHENRRDAIS